MDFGRPNAEIGRKMANGQQLLLTLYLKVIHLYFQFLMFGGGTPLLTIFNSLSNYGILLHVSDLQLYNVV